MADAPEQSSSPEQSAEVVQLLDEGIDQARKGRYRLAEQSFKKAIELAPEDPEGHYNLGVLYGMLANMDIKVDGWFEDRTDEQVLMEKAIACYDMVLTLDSEHIHALNNLATHYAVQGLVKQAINCLRRSLEIDPDQPDVQSELEELESSSARWKVVIPEEPVDNMPKDAESLDEDD